MSSSNTAPGHGEKAGQADSAQVAAAKPPMRDALVAAAFQLFLERGYEQTTVDDIVALAGVGRRSFFRYFPSKEDVVFPDHEALPGRHDGLPRGRRRRGRAGAAGL